MFVWVDFGLRDGGPRGVGSFSSLLKNGTSVAVLSLAFAAAGISCAQASGALPSNGHYVSGSGHFSKSPGALSIDQTSTTGIIDWKSFSVGKANSIDFNNGSGATLNRVTGGNISRIEGSLSATGSVYVMNSQGVIVSKTGRIDTGGSFVAAGGNIGTGVFDSDAGFGITHARGKVLNHGKIQSDNGDVVLVGTSVRNTGTLTAARGTAMLGAGTDIVLTPQGSQHLSVAAGTGNVANSGSIDAAAAELRAANGNVYALSGNNGGIIRATGTDTIAGHVWLTSAGGRTVVNSTIAARNADASGGNVETSGRNLSIAHADIDAGENGKWLVDPMNLTVKSGAATTIEKTLNKGTNVVLKTTKTGASGPGGTSKGAGDIVIDSAITWSSGATFALDAYHNVKIEQVIKNTGKGNLSAEADDTGTGVGTVVFSGKGEVDFSKSKGGVGFLYNPSDNPKGSKVNTTSYTTPTDFSKDVKTKSASQFSALMLVNTVNDLQNMQNNEHGYYALGRDINASATQKWNLNTQTSNSYYAGFIPIGQNSGGFSGVFDGLNHTIKNLYEAGGILQFQSGGLFSLLFGGLILNVKLSNVDLEFGANGGFVGGLVGYLESGTVSNSSSSGKVSSQGEGKVGGLVGESDSTISKSHSSAIVIATAGGSNAGGLVGLNYGTIESSWASGNVTDKAANADVGGLVGFNNALEGVGIIKNSHATGDVAGGTSSLGGDADVGGLVGYNIGTSGGKESVPAAKQKVKIIPGTIINSFATGKVSDAGAYEYIGGFIGYNDNYGFLFNDYSTGVVSGGRDALIGGFAGANNADIVEAYAIGNVTGAQGDEVGGFAGHNSGNIVGDYAKGNVKAGNADSASPRSSAAGGLVGLNQSLIQESYAKGSVTVGATTSKSNGAIAYGGGLVGDNYGGTLNQVYSIGAVKGGKKSILGGLFGESGMSATAAYWDTQTSGMKSGVGYGSKKGITGLTTAQLKSGLPNGFNTMDWAIQKGSTFPYLQWAKSVGAPLSVPAVHGCVASRSQNMKDSCS